MHAQVIPVGFDLQEIEDLQTRLNCELAVTHKIFLAQMGKESAIRESVIQINFSSVSELVELNESVAKYLSLETGELSGMKAEHLVAFATIQEDVYFIYYRNSDDDPLVYNYFIGERVGTKKLKFSAFIEACFTESKSPSLNPF